VQYPEKCAPDGAIPMLCRSAGYQQWCSGVPAAIGQSPRQSSDFF
jgi:hypothetical protein